MSPHMLESQIKSVIVGGNLSFVAPIQHSFHKGYTTSVIQATMANMLKYDVFDQYYILFQYICHYMKLFLNGEYDHYDVFEW